MLLTDEQAKWLNEESKTLFNELQQVKAGVIKYTNPFTNITKVMRYDWLQDMITLHNIAMREKKEKDARTADLG
jgi:hypothetical protein